MKQNKENRDNYTSKLLQVFEENNFRKMQKSELVEILQIDERSVRRCLEKLSNFKPVIAFSNSRGYKVLKDVKEIDHAEVDVLKNDIQHQLNELNSRISKLKKRMNPLIAYLYELEKVGK